MRNDVKISGRNILVLLLLMVVLLLAMPRTGKFNYDYRKGSRWNYETLTADFDFPILKTSERYQAEREKAESAIVPYYVVSQKAGMNAIRAAESLSMGDYSSIKPKIASELSGIYARGVLADEALSTQISDPDGVIFLRRENRSQEKVPVSEVFTVSGAKTRLLASIAADNTLPSVDSLFSAAGVYELIVPNLIYDEETTRSARLSAADYISPTEGYVNAGDLIVSKGDIVTAEIQQLLDSYKVEYEQSVGYGHSLFFLWLGNLLLSALIVVLLALTIYFTNPAIFADRNRFLYLITIFAIAALAAFFVEKANPQMLYMAPFTLTALYLLAFFKKRVVLPVYFLSLVPMLIFAHNGVELFVMFLLSGVVTMIVFDYFNRGWRQFVTAFIAFVCLVVTYIAFHFANDAFPLGRPELVYLFVGSMLTVAGYPLIYLFEKIFMLVSNTRLQELCDTGNPLPVEMSQKAPGTFQHCLQVMNLSEAAARSIGANVLLVRAGALYHDIGKILNPQCFIENENLGAHYHEGLSPKQSAQDIIRHVPDGMELAKKHSLPEVVSDFILTHHGTSSTGYFYNKYINEGGDPTDVDAFFYKGRKPRTKEQTIVMLCDTLEAASRTLKDTTPESFDAFVEKIVAGKMNAGQLDDADISLRELGIIKSVLKSYLARMYHDRVEYPDRKDN